MITCHYRNGRLAEILYMTYGLFYFCIQNDIPLTDIKIDKDYTGQDFYNKKCQHVIQDNLPIFANIKKSLTDHATYDNIFKNAITIDQQMQQFNYIAYDSSKNYILTNFWHFPVRRNLFKALFKPILVVQQLIDTYSSIDFKLCCAVHIRRGDFIKIQHDQALKKKFYDKKPMQISEIRKKISAMQNNNAFIKHILVFSDDINWCKCNMKNMNVTFVDGNKPYEDLLLISMCSRHIMTNGSYFSYCGALLK